jgi:NAD(P)-dependent dehydrogenase (short-subunit alcohol dehydrogenase family)
MESARYPDLAGRVAVVTGGSRGLGAATCLALARSGARVAVSGRDLAAMAEVVAAIRAEGGEAIAVPANVTRQGDLAALRDRAEAALGPVELLAAFAGGDGQPGATASMAEAAWRSVVDGNLTATFLTLQAFLPGMISRGRGAIVTMASSAGRIPSRSSAAYAAAKAGVVMLTRHLANELGPQGVRINCLAPSAILTDRTARLMPGEIRDRVAAAHPLGRIGTPEDVAQACLFLLSDSADWITGVTLDVAGGRVTA